MNELTKVKRVMQKCCCRGPHDVLLVLDGSTGQNAFEQAKQFTAATEVTALAVTKARWYRQAVLLLNLRSV
jgi:fused signal recognition particle receptor